MAFAAARMIKDKKDQQELKKKSTDGLLPKQKSKLNVPSSRSPSVSSSRSGGNSSDTSSAKARAKNASRGGKSNPGRSNVKCVKRVKGKRGMPDKIELLVTIDLALHKLNDAQVAEYKEVFLLFDKDEDGVLSFPELNVAMKSLGQRPTEKTLLTMVRSVSEDKLYDTIEFNEFLQMMSRQNAEEIDKDSLMEAFKIFDKDKDGFLTVDELKRIMSQLGERMSQRELDDLVSVADSDGDGLVNCNEFCTLLTNQGQGRQRRHRGRKKKGNRENKDRIKEENKENTEKSSQSGSADTLSK